MHRPRRTSNRYAQYMGPILEALRSLGESANPAEAEDKVIELMAIPSDEVEERYEKTGSRIISTNIAFAASGLRFYGLIAGIDGVWTLTEAGRHRHISDQEADELARKWNAIRRDRSLGVTVEVPGPDSPDSDPLEATVEAPPSLLQLLQALSPEGFERLAQLVLRKAGFSKVVVTQQSNDKGIDGYGILEVNELVSFRMVFQCKRYLGQVGSGAVRDFRGAMAGRADKGIMITTGTFSPEAEKEALRDGVPPVELVDGERLVELMQRLQIGVEPRTVYDVDHAFFDPYR